MSAAENDYTSAFFSAARSDDSNATKDETPTTGMGEVSEQRKTSANLSMVANLSAVLETAAKHPTFHAPAPMRDFAGWLIWRFEKGEGDKPRKVPYYANGGRRLGRQGDANDVGQLVTFANACKAARAQSFNGVGFATLPQFGITALDCDHCVTDGTVDPEVLKLVNGTYAELSPSGQGVRAFVAGTFGANRKSHASAVQWGLEVFCTKGFVTVTGNVLELTKLTGCENTVAPISETLKAEYAKRFGDATTRATDAQPIGLTAEQLSDCLAALDPDMGYNDWLSVGMALHHETCGDSDALELWIAWSAKGAKYQGRESLESRWEGFGRNGDGAAVTAGTLMKMSRAAGASVGQVANESEFAVIPEDPAPPGGHFNIRSAAEFTRKTKPVTWLVKGVLPKATMGVLYGASGSGKSFVCLDMACAIARGDVWNGRRVKQSRVLYIVAEGAGDFSLRLSAYCQHFGVDIADLPVDIIDLKAPNLLLALDIKQLIEDIRSREHYDLIIIDTLAQATPGANENSAEDMGRALGHCRTISQVVDAMVLLVHHSGKDASKGARGWSGIYAAADVMLEVTRKGDARAIAVEKQKGGRDGESFGFSLVTEKLAEDEDGDGIYSCVVNHVGQLAKRMSKSKPLGGLQNDIVNIAHTLAGFSPEGRIGLVKIVDGVVAAHEVEGKTTRKGNVLRALKQLILREALNGNDEYVQIPGDPDA